MTGVSDGESGMTRVLFVDDEQLILDGLKRLLYPLRNQWEMHFATSGEQALQLLSENDFDVLISDMMMPGMDGAELLNRVRQQYPSIVRIILSGHSDKELIYRALGSTHVYLSKPSDRDSIEGAIRRASELDQILNDENLTRLISSLDTLPSLPNLYFELLDVLKSKYYSIKKVTEVITKDAGMTAKLLQLVNSAFFGLPRHISDPKLAINLLGLDVLVALVMTVQIFTQFESASLIDISFQQFWDHCSGTSSLAKTLAERQGLPHRVIDDTFAAGLLHDSGKIILMGNEPEKYRQVRDLMEREGIDNFHAEEMVYGSSHPVVGAYLLGLWGLPTSIVEAVAFHHQSDKPGLSQNPIPSFVYLANLLERPLRNGREDEVKRIIEGEFVQSLGLRYPLKQVLDDIRNKQQKEDR